MRVLVADDEPVSLRLLQARLGKWGFEVVTASDGLQAWEKLEQLDGPSLAVLDWMMPGLDGLEVCRRVRAQARESYVYVLLLTSRDRQWDRVEGLRAGADNFLQKPFDDDELEASLRSGQRIVDLHAELIAAREALRALATRDALTGMMNRRAIIETLGRELTRAHRERAPIAVAIADLDRFKLVNDTYGHGAGDVVLREAAARMTSSIRTYDWVGRYGGEEFLVVLPGCDSESGRVGAERLRSGIAAAPVAFGGALLPITCSVGVAAAGEAAGWDAEGLVRAADAALYEAKSSGRDRVVVAAAHSPVRDTGGSAAILIIEDDTAMRDTLEDMLREEGFRVRAVADGGAGVRAAREETPDLVVCDIVMEGLDGYGVLAALRQEAATGATPFIFLTARAGRSNERQGIESGADAYLTKPLSRDELLRAVRSRLDARKPRERVTEQGP